MQAVLCFRDRQLRAVEFPGPAAQRAAGHPGHPGQPQVPHSPRAQVHITGPASIAAAVHWKHTHSCIMFTIYALTCI